MDCSLPGSSVLGILQARKLEWVAIPFSRGSSYPKHWTWSPALQAYSIRSELPGKPCWFRSHCLNTGLCAIRTSDQASQLGMTKETMLEAWRVCVTGNSLSESESCSVGSYSLWLRGLYNPWNSPGQNTGVGSLSLLQGIFPTQWSNPSLLYYRQILYQLSHKGSPVHLITNKNTNY